jgi:hypothetical protein
VLNRLLKGREVNSKSLSIYIGPCYYCDADLAKYWASTAAKCHRTFSKPWLDFISKAGITTELFSLGFKA